MWRPTDPGQKYRDAVKRQLIDAMLDHSKSMDLEPDEWLTVAARGSECGADSRRDLPAEDARTEGEGQRSGGFPRRPSEPDEARQKVAVRQFWARKHSHG